MRSLQQWFDEYAENHQNLTNKAIHYICVPAIFFSITGLLMSIPSHFIFGDLATQYPLLFNFAMPAMLCAMLFYFRLSMMLGFKMLVFATLCICINFFIGQWLPLWLISLIIFSIAWIGQFYGHTIEGKKPSFFKDLQFLLIGPAWVMDNLSRQ